MGPFGQGYEMMISFERFIITIVSQFEPRARIITISGLNTSLHAGQQVRGVVWELGLGGIMDQ